MIELAAERKKWVKLDRGAGRSTGCKVPVDGFSFETMMKARNLTDVPFKKLRATRYLSKDSLIIRFQNVDDIPLEELDCKIAVCCAESEDNNIVLDLKTNHLHTIKCVEREIEYLLESGYPRLEGRVIHLKDYIETGKKREKKERKKK